MSPKPRPGGDDSPEVTDTTSTSRHDGIVRDQFRWEVAETLELIRTVSMSDSSIEAMSAAEIFATCIDNLLELGRSLGLESFTEAVRDLDEVLQHDPLDGPLVDKHLDQVSQARWAWPSGDDA